MTDVAAGIDALEARLAEVLRLAGEEQAPCNASASHVSGDASKSGPISPPPVTSAADRELARQLANASPRPLGARTSDESWLAAGDPWRNNNY
jgi:hypothetical protein